MHNDDAKTRIANPLTLYRATDLDESRIDRLIERGENFAVHFEETQEIVLMTNIGNGRMVGVSYPCSAPFDQIEAVGFANGVQAPFQQAWEGAAMLQSQRWH